MVKKIFVSAVGTDIGKTYISALLVKKMREYGFDCGYFKPVLSGVTNGVLGDCKHVIEVSNLNCDMKSCVSYYFDEAVSPHLAAKRCGIEIKVDKIMSDFESYKKNYDYFVIEGAGGITCPLSVSKPKIVLLSDLVKLLCPRVILVSNSGLGAINSVLTSVEYIQNRGISIAGIVMNNFDKTDFMHIDNKFMIEKLTNLKVIATVGENDEDIDITREDLEKLFCEG